MNINVGMPLADARARYPELMTIHADPDADLAHLKQIAEFCERYTPLVALAPPDMLLLDISGCSHLFDGEDGLATDLQARLRNAGFTAHVSCASSVGCAIAMARCGRTAIIRTGEESIQLAALPLSALRLPAETITLLKSFGLHQIGDLYDRPRASLTARFGDLLLTRLDQALGMLEEPISPMLPVPPYIAEQRFSEPIGREEDVLGTIENLGIQLVRLMEKRQEGGRSFICDLFRVDGAIRRLIVTTGRPLKDPRAIRRLFTERLALIQDFDPGFGFDLIRLCANNSDNVLEKQTELDETTRQEPDLSELIDRFNLRFGKHGVLHFHPQDCHLPEQAILAAPVIDPPTQSAPSTALPRQDSLAPLRPIRLLARPESIDALAEVPDGPPLRFRWRRVIHDVTTTEGPERIAPEWWRSVKNTDQTRDYFRVETSEGARLWLYREGLYRNGISHPHWFVHGLFA